MAITPHPQFADHADQRIKSRRATPARVFLAMVALAVLPLAAVQLGGCASSSLDSWAQSADSIAPLGIHATAEFSPVMPVRYELTRFEERRETVDASILIER